MSKQVTWTTKAIIGFGWKPAVVVYVLYVRKQSEEEEEKKNAGGTYQHRFLQVLNIHQCHKPVV